MKNEKYPHKSFLDKQFIKCLFSNEHLCVNINNEALNQCFNIITTEPFRKVKKIILYKLYAPTFKVSNNAIYPNKNKKVLDFEVPFPHSDYYIPFEGGKYNLLAMYNYRQEPGFSHEPDKWDLVNFINVFVDAFKFLSPDYCTFKQVLNFECSKCGNDWIFDYKKDNQYCDVCNPDKITNKAVPFIKW